MSTKLQPNLLLQQQIKGRFLPTSLNNRAEIALTFSAMDQQSQRPVILKYYQQNSHRDIQDAIQRGVMLHAQVRSDHIVPLIDFGVHGQYGGVWCVLAREDSPNLTRFVKSQEGLSSRETCEILMSLCDALQELHASDRIHGNLKPTNVFVKSRPGEPLKALVSDILGAGLSRVHKMSSGRVTFNDPSFFTYEQASGKTMDAQTDIASLGLLAYFMLNSKQPFEGRTTDKLLTAVIIGSGRIKIKASDLHGSQQQNEALADLINQCLSKQSSSRPTDISSLKSSLQTVYHLGQEQGSVSPSGLDILDTYQQKSSLGLQSLTPNHSLMNSLGYGQTLGFEAISDQMMNQYQSAQQSTQTRPSTAPPKVTGSQQAIITAPPRGFEPETISTSFPLVDQTSNPTPFSSSEESQTIMGGLSFDELNELHNAGQSPQTPIDQSLDIDEAVKTGMELSEDTRPITPQELQQLGMISPLSSKSDMAEDWGDLNQWNGLAFNSPDHQASTNGLIPAEEQTNPDIKLSEIQADDLSQLGVDEFELDLLLEQAANALEVEGLNSEDPSTLELDLHQIDINQQSTLFNQAIRDPEYNDYSQALGNYGGESDNPLDLEETARIDVDDLMDGQYDRQESLSERFQASTQDQDLKYVSVQGSSEALDSNSEGNLFVPELFSSPASGITPERATLDSEITERLQIPQAIEQLELDDFAMMDTKRSGAFPMIGTQESRDIEMTQLRQSTQALPGRKMEQRELDTQLEFQRPEEIFPDVPEWRSLVNLKDRPLELSKALLSIPLPLSGQLLPFSQFQLEIEGKEHEEGFFVKRPFNTPHIPVILDPEEEVAANPSSAMWEVITEQPSLPEQKSNAVYTPSNIPKPKGTATQTILNLSLFVVALILTGIGLMLGSGMELDEIMSLVTGDPQVIENYPRVLPSKSTKVVQPKAVINSEIPDIQPTSNQTPPIPNIDISVKESKEVIVRPKSRLKQKPTLQNNNEKRTSHRKKSLKKRKARNKISAPKPKIPKRKRKKRRKSSIVDPFAN